MKVRKNLYLFIAAFCSATLSFSQIRDGKYVFYDETCVTGCSSHIFTQINLADARAVTNVMLQEVMSNWATGLKSQVLMYENIDLMITDIENGRLDLIALTTPEYIMLRDHVRITPFLTYKIEDKTLDRMFLVSRRDSGIRSILHLKGKKIAVYTVFNDNLNLPYLWLTVRILKNRGNYTNEYAPNIYSTQKGSNAISDVFFGNADAAVVSERSFISSRELNPQIGTQLSVIDSSDYMLYSVLCHTEKIVKSLGRFKDRDIQTVTDMLCEADKTEIGKNFLTIFRITSFIPFEKEYLKGTEALFSDYQVLSVKKTGK